MTRRNQFAIVGAIMLLGAVLRLYQIGTQSLWFDELLSVSIARLPLQEVIYSPASIDPPLFYVLLHYWLSFGSGDGIIRLLPAFAAVATIPAIYALGTRLFDAKVGWAAALIFAVAPLQLYHAQEVRMYPQLILLSTVSIWAYARAQASMRLHDWAALVGAMALALYTHTFAGLVLLALDADALMKWRSKNGHLRWLIFSNVAIGILLFPWLVLWLQKLEWLLPALGLQPPTILHPLLTLNLFVFGYTLPFPLSTVALFILLLALVFVLSAGWRTLRHGVAQEREGIQLVLLVMLLPLLVTFLVSQWRSVYVDRLLLESSPAIYILLAWGLVKSDRRGAIRICALAGLPFVLMAILNYYSNVDYARPPLRDVIAYVASHRASDELVVHTSDSSFLAGRQYDSPGKHILLYHPADQWLTPALMEELRVPFETDASQMVSGQERYWVVVATDHIPDEQLAEKAFFDRQGILLEQNQIGGVSIYQYARNQAAQ